MWLLEECFYHFTNEMVRGTDVVRARVVLTVLGQRDGGLVISELE